MTTNKNKTVLYAGATNAIERRLNEHHYRIYPNTFTKRYNYYVLIYFEECEEVNNAFVRERQLKSWRRKKKEELINASNTNGEDIELVSSSSE
ncbi:GIY-YIG nuclease family protein [Aggregatimonas sangjinii]|uniref:GIY-YIG nuclease family protein n=1 Tax=Aggregatimonas sangjinii TaxID=2583587 RepID=A0A5B7SW05_9FLAO|nr:GIY-YIG nuclease family protein [Aggregatimonas sangjinii]